jgi:hypothetical protein
MAIQSYLHKLTRNPPHITAYKILKKVVFRLKTEVESCEANLSPTNITDGQLLELLINQCKEIVKLINHIKERQEPKFFLYPSEQSGMVNLISSYFINATAQTIADADKICSHVFNLLGSGDVYLGEKINWHIDFKTGWKWKPKYYKKIDSVVLGNPCDVKVPWELSRCQHFVTLGKAYWYTGDERYAEEFVAQVNDWIESNPPKFGVNWVCTMDVAIRAVNWIWGYYFFKDSSCLTDEFMLGFLKSILIHGRYIMNNLENKFEVISNHYLSDIVGLIYLGIIFPEFKEAKEWREYGIKELVNEMGRQVYEDGVDFEASISYHRLVTELFLSSTILGLKNNVVFPDWYMKRLEKMVEFTMYYSKPDGTAPQIGDNDDGRLHILSNYGNWNKLDHRYLLSIGSVIFNRPDFKKFSGGFHEEAFWLLGEEGIKQFNSIPDTDTELSSKDFPVGGIYIMRKGDFYMIVDCGTNGQGGNGGHAHNDTLSFELYAGDTTFIVDPGTYVYTADYKMRNLFRSTAYHNTVVIDGQEMNRFNEYDLFSMKNDAFPTINKWISTNEYDFLDAQHNGYAKLSDPVIYRRQVYFSKLEPFWVIKDMVTGQKVHKYDFYFHFSPMQVEFIERESMIVQVGEANKNKLTIIPIKLDSVSVEVLNGWISCSYGVKISASILKYYQLKEKNTEFFTVIVPDRTVRNSINIMEFGMKVKDVFDSFIEEKFQV